MGSLRRGIRQALYLALALCPTAAIAEVCDKERPFWSRADGPASAWDELIGLSTLPISLALISLAGLALLTRWRILFALTGLLWAGLALRVIAEHYGPIRDDARYFAINEGCIGPPHLFIALAIAICGSMVYGALRPRT